MILHVVTTEGSLAPIGVGQSQPTCMIVEDQALIGFSLKAYLEEAGFGRCEVFPSAAETLAWLATHTPTVAVLDYTLTDGPCTTLTGILAERGIPFVIYSGHKRSAHHESFGTCLGSANHVIGRFSWRLSLRPGLNRSTFGKILRLSELFRSPFLSGSARCEPFYVLALPCH